jgi:hypothetical protein
MDQQKNILKKVIRFGSISQDLEGDCTNYPSVATEQSTKGFLVSLTDPSHEIFVGFADDKVRLRLNGTALPGFLASLEGRKLECGKRGQTTSVRDRMSDPSGAYGEKLASDKGRGQQNISAGFRTYNSFVAEGR